MESLSLASEEDMRLVVPLPYDHWSEAQQISLAISWKIGGFFSLIGSIYIIHDILGHPERRRNKLPLIYNRIMLGVAITDLILDVFAFLPSSSLIPRDTLHSNFIWGNIGNSLTCEIQGALAEFGALSSIFYYFVLTIYFVLFIKYSWSETRLRRYEPFMHGIAILFPAIAAALSVKFELNNPGIFFCWANEYPINCNRSDDVECIRGDNVRSIVRLFFLTIPSAFVLISVAAMMISLYCFVRRQDLIMNRYGRSESSTGAKHTVVFKRACQYIGVLVICWIPMIFLTAFMKVSWISPTAIYLLALTEAILTPFYGLLNAMVYCNAGPKEFCSLVIRRLYSNEANSIMIRDLSTAVPSSSQMQSRRDPGNLDAAVISQDEANVVTFEMILQELVEPTAHNVDENINNDDGSGSDDGVDFMEYLRFSSNV